MCYTSIRGKLLLQIRIGYLMHYTSIVSLKWDFGTHPPLPPLPPPLLPPPPFPPFLENFFTKPFRSAKPDLLYEIETNETIETMKHVHVHVHVSPHSLHIRVGSS